MDQTYAIIKKEIDFSESEYISSCKICNDDIYTRGPQNYIIYYYEKKPLTFCSLFCFMKFIGDVK